MVLNDLQDFQSTYKITAERAKSREPIKEKPNWEQGEKGESKSALAPCLSQNYSTPQRRTIIDANQSTINTSQFTCKNLAGNRTNV